MVCSRWLKWCRNTGCEPPVDQPAGKDPVLSRQLLKSTATIGGMTLISRVFGLIRDIVIARLFGADAGTDAFFVAFRIPNFFRRLFGEGAFSQAFVPVLTEYKVQREHDQVRALVDHTAARLGWILLLVTAAGVLAAPVLILVFAPGFHGEAGQVALASDMLRLTFPYVFFVCMTALAGAILNTYRQFAIPAFTPVLLNLALIGCAIWLAPRLENPITALAWGVLLAGVVQLVFQAPFLLRLKLMPRPWRRRDTEGVGRIVKLMLPALFGVSVAQINVLVDTLMASFLVAGSITWLYYADRMMEFPLGIFGIALATVILPQLSDKHARKAGEDFSATLDWALRWVLLMTVPAFAGLVVLAAPIMATLFQYNEFTPYDAVMASHGLMAFALGLPAFVLVKILASAFFSRQDTRTPVRAGVVAMVVNIILNLALIAPLAHAGLALATALAACVNAGLLYVWLMRTGVYQPQPGWHVFGLRIVGAVLVMGVVLWFMIPAFETWLPLSAFERAVQLTMWIIAGMLIYPAALWLFGLRPDHLRNRSA